VAQTARPEHTDLFDGPSWDGRDVWDAEPKHSSPVAVVSQLFVGLLAGLVIPLCFAGFLAALMWGFGRMFHPIF
jgi:hypothetical protein